MKVTQPRKATVNTDSPVKIVLEHPSPDVSVIIPSLDGYREGNVPRLIESLKKPSRFSFEIILVRNVSPNGRARDEGVHHAKGRYYIFLDDDVTVASENFIESLIIPFEDNSLGKIGMTGASYLIPPHATTFEKAVAKQLPRVECPIVEAVEESDMVCHACLCVPAALYREVGGESRTLVSGTDPDFKARIRKQGYKIVLAAKTLVYMAPHKNFSTLCRKAFTTGRRSKLTQNFAPHRVHPSTALHGQTWVGQRSGKEKVRYHLEQLGRALRKGHWIYVADRICYAAGYLSALLKLPV